MAPSAIPSISGSLNFSALRSSFCYHQSVAVFKWELSGDRDAKLVTRRSKAQTFRVLENPNVSPGKDGSIKEVIMVDPLEAKRLAAKQMDRIKAKEKFKRSCQIEAINGAWAMIGLTAGIVIEGHTGNGILSQLAGYWEAIVHFFMR